MAPAIGLILTHAPDLPWLRAQLAAARADTLKVVPAWGLAGGWTPAAIAETAHLTPHLIVRTSWGDPSYDHGARSMPIADRILNELAPWLAARPDATIELGNEPLLTPLSNEQPAWAYAWYLGQTIDALRAQWPQARLIAPAHMRNHLVQLGEHMDGQARWDAIAAPVYRRCDILGLHAYSVAQAVGGIHQLRDLVSAELPIWLTEFALNEPLDDIARAQRYAAVLADLPVAVACLYHLDATEAAPSAEQGPARYRLASATLSALGQAHPPLGGAPAVPDTVRYAERIDRFLMDIRQWRTVAAFRRHLAGYQAAQVAPWATGITVHHTVAPLPSTWRGVANILAMARFYRDDPRYGWDRGPHLYIVSGASNAVHDGIWQLTPLNATGIHAASFNKTHWGLEVVGSFDSQRWDAGTAALALGTLAALHDWAGWPAVSAATLNGHRDDPKTTKTCPGKAIDLAAVRRGVAVLRGRA